MPEHEKPSPSRAEVWRMFDRIAPRYDLLNHLLSGGQDLLWRRAMARRVDGPRDELKIADIATGTADQLIAMCRSCRRITHAVGIDMSHAMLEIGRKKLAGRGLDGQALLIHGDGMRLPLGNDTIDCVTITFGIRNMTDVARSLNEMCRVLRPGGRVLILEFGLPKNRIFRAVYLWYFRHILPRLGALISGDSVAYHYLNKTVETFPYGDAFCSIMADSGFGEVSATPLNFGIAQIYQGQKVTP